MSKLMSMSVAALLAFSVFRGSAALPQEPPKKDDELDKFLEKIEATKPSKPDTSIREKDSKTSKSGEKSKADTKSKPSKSKESGDVAPKDKELDSFLEKLGETKETPAPDDRPRGAPKPADEPIPPKPGKPSADSLKGESKELDKHLEELTGRRRKKDPREEEGSGPLGKVVKEMRDVEERLGKPDTGEETRQKQAEIVKNLDSIIEQLRSMSPSQGRRMMLALRPGRQPGQQPGEQPGTQGGNAPHTKPVDPKKPRPVVGSKDAWGHLPPEARQELENIFKEESLEARRELIERYYLSLSKKTVRREE